MYTIRFLFTRNETLGLGEATTMIIGELSTLTYAQHSPNSDARNPPLAPRRAVYRPTVYQKNEKSSN